MNELELDECSDIRCNTLVLPGQDLCKKHREGADAEEDDRRLAAIFG